MRFATSACNPFFDNKTAAAFNGLAAEQGWLLEQFAFTTAVMVAWAHTAAAKADASMSSIGALTSTFPFGSRILIPRTQIFRSHSAHDCKWPYIL